MTAHPKHKERVKYQHNQHLHDDADLMLDLLGSPKCDHIELNQTFESKQNENSDSVNQWENDSKTNVNRSALNPYFSVKPQCHDLMGCFSFELEIAKYLRNELESESHHHTDGPVDILRPFYQCSLRQLRTNHVIHPRNLCLFLQQHRDLVVLKASVRYRRDWSESENEWFWNIPKCLPSTLEMFFLPGHHSLPSLWVEKCLSSLHRLTHFDFFIVNHKYIPSVSLNTIYVLAKHCPRIQCVHLHINLEEFIRDRIDRENKGNSNGKYKGNSKENAKKIHRRSRSMNTKHSRSLRTRADLKVVFAKELGNALQLLFTHCLDLQRAYVYLSSEFEPRLLLQQISFIKLPSKRKCKLKNDEYQIGGVKCQRFVFKFGDQRREQSLT